MVVMIRVRWLMIRIKVLASIAMIDRRVTIIRDDDTITAKISRATAEPQKRQLQPVNAAGP